MARERSPNRDRAFEIYREHDGKISNRQIAELLSEDEKKIAVWKQRDKWNVVQQLANVVQQSPDNVVQQKKKCGAPQGNNNAKGHGAPKNNKNAVGNRGGPGGPPGNKKAEKHGFFARIFPNDDETREIVESINLKSPLEMLWENIVIQYTAIARAQKIMFVKDKEEMIKELKRSYEKNTERSTTKTKSDAQECEYEYEFQFSWDRQATFLKAQSAAMKTLEGLLSRYEEMLRSELATEEQQARIDKLRAEVARIKGDDGTEEQGEEDTFLAALKGKAPEVWDDDGA